MRWVVDASCVIPFLVPEDLSPDALAFFSRHGDFMAPGFLRLEVANLFWRLARTGKITAAQAIGSLESLGKLGLAFRDVRVTDRDILEMALELDHPVFDCAYLAHAVAERATLVTADTRFLRRIGQGRWAGRAVHLADAHRLPLTPPAAPPAGP